MEYPTADVRVYRLRGFWSFIFRTVDNSAFSRGYIYHNFPICFGFLRFPGSLSDCSIFILFYQHHCGIDLLVTDLWQWPLLALDAPSQPFGAIRGILHWNYRAFGNHLPGRSFPAPF